MIGKQQIQKKRNGDISSRIINVATEEVEKFGQSVASQFSSEKQDQEQENPITEAMQQSTEEVEKVDVSNKRKFIRTREELECELKKISNQENEKMLGWKEGVDEKLKIVSPGEKIKSETVLPLTTKPKRGMMPGTPGTAKGGSGMEVIKSKQ